MTDTQDYIRVTVPAPGEQRLTRILRTDLSYASRIWEPIVTIGVWEPTNLLSDMITVGLSHV